MLSVSYLARRHQVENYFDRTAVEAWSRLTSDAPVGRIRATVRAGRDEMRRTLLDWLPTDLRGRRLLDAGCGTGALAVAAARRGARVVAVDLSPTLIELARERAPRDLGAGCVEFMSGDMLDPGLGRFDHVVGMDSLIHYGMGDAVSAVAGLAARTHHSVSVHVRPADSCIGRHACGRTLLSPWQPRAVGGAGDRGGDCANPGGRAEAWRVARWAISSCRQRLLYVAGPGARRLMTSLGISIARGWMRVGTRFLPFADAATAELPLGRLMRLSLFQVSVGIAVVLLNGTLNRVMIVELGVPSWLVAAMVALPLLFAPFRALIGFRSDTHRSALGWRRVPYIWFGTLLQFGGLAIMPFALIVLSGDADGPPIVGQIGAALAFLLVGAGLHTTQTAGLALATDLAPPEARPRVVAFLYVMLLFGMVASAFLFGVLLANFRQVLLIQVVQGAALATIILNVIALWKQEARNPVRTAAAQPRPTFRESWSAFRRDSRTTRVFVAVALGTAAFTMQDILLEPYGGEILNLTVSESTSLTAIFAVGTLLGFALAARSLGRGGDAYRLAALGTLVGLVAFSAVIFSAPLTSPLLLRIGTVLIGFGGGLFAVGTLTAAMDLARDGQSGLALGAWGAVQATAAGIAIALGGGIRDLVSGMATQGLLGPALNMPSTGYGFVYHIEIALLFATLIAIGPLVRPARVDRSRSSTKFGLAEFPG